MTENENETETETWNENEKENDEEEEVVYKEGARGRERTREIQRIKKRPIRRTST